MHRYRPRAIDPLLTELLSELPAVMIVGPRATGKTTTAMRHAATTIHLDHAPEAEAFRADPDAALRGLAEPVLLDEWQVVPEVLGAVKRAVDTETRPGRFLLTGSVRAHVESATWPGTGRVVRLTMYPMTVAERDGRDVEPLFDRVVRGDELAVPDDPPDLRGYVELALRGGFPPVALSPSSDASERWIDAYVEHILTRDVQAIEPRRDPTRLRRYFEAYALNSAGLVEDKALIEAAGINRKTAMAYERLLTDLMVVDSLPAWSSNRVKRLVRSPKRYVIDPALMIAPLRLGVSAVMRDGGLLGRVIETFAVAHLRADLSVARTRPRLYHLRQESGRHEVDVVAEQGGDRVIGIEVKASSAPDRQAGRHLAWLRDELGSRFIGGLILHTGPRVYEVDAQIVAAPICTLWA